MDGMQLRVDKFMTGNPIKLNLKRAQHLNGMTNTSSENLEVAVALCLANLCRSLLQL